MPDHANTMKLEAERLKEKWDRVPECESCKALKADPIQGANRYFLLSENEVKPVFDRTCEVCSIYLQLAQPKIENSTPQ
jgi:hypothetical protein